MDLLNHFAIEDSDLRKVLNTALGEIDHPRALTVWLLFKYGEHNQLAGLKYEPEQYNTLGDAQGAFKATELLRKSTLLEGITDDERREAATAKAVAAEQRCFNTNRKLKDLAYGYEENPRAYKVLTRAQRKIAYVLGSFDPNEWLKNCRWGPGSDALIKRPYVSSYHKLVGRQSLTVGARRWIWVLSQFSYTLSRWLAQQEEVDGPFSPLCEILEGNTFTTVRKTALTDRSICIEPGWNIFLQLGVGGMIRSRLKWRAAIDLDSQELNRWLALEGSREGFFCTLDLSSASDTVARFLVQLLLSPEFNHLVDPAWFDVMDAIRSKFTVDFPNKGTSWLNEKFSSMGNGYTFELETLVFWALSTAAAEETQGHCWAVYGDDIVVDRYSYPSVVEWLEYFGFEVNTKKSFEKSYFRESCGMNGWDGFQMESFRFSDLSTLSKAYSAINGLRRIGCAKAANQLTRLIPKELRFYGPDFINPEDDRLGDIVISSENATDWNPRIRGKVDQYFFWSYEIRCLAFEPAKAEARWLEPAVIHSLATCVPAGDHPLCGDRGWGSEGFASLSRGTWKVGRTLIPNRNAMGELTVLEP